jgi:hypothetical protein
VEVLAGGEAACLEKGPDPLARRAGVGRRLEHDQLALLQARRDVLRGREQDRQVRLALVGERGWERDEDRVRLAQCVVVRRRGYAARVDVRLQRL